MSNNQTVNRNQTESSMAPSFFKILENPSAPHFILPPEFVRKYMRNGVVEELVTLTANGGRSWVLKIEQIGESYRFTNGWKQVVKDIPLGYWENLVFHLVDESAFNMTIYSRNGCELLLPVKKEFYEDEGEDVYDEYTNVVVIEDDEKEEEKESDVADGDSENNEVGVTETEVVKRKRGRPRKQPEPSSEVTVIEVKRKRGRPRKQPRVPIEFPTTELVNRLRWRSGHERGGGETVRNAT